MKESETTEFKKSLAELGDGLNSVAAILNTWIINAFCHRDYRDPEEVRIAIFPDRVEVRNPGTLMEGVTLRTLKTAKVSRRRNPLIADLLRRIQYIEAWGRGIPLILEKAPNVRFSQVAGIFITASSLPAANYPLGTSPPFQLLPNRHRHDPNADSALRQRREAPQMDPFP